MNDRKIIICAGTTSSGSSGVFDYLRCYDNAIAINREYKQRIYRDIYLKWVKDKTNTKKYKEQLINFLNKKYERKSRRHNINIDNKTFLLSNVITCLTLDGIELFDNLIVFCVLRDPRSTWLRKQQLLARHGLTMTVERFCKGFKKQRQIFENHLNKLKNKDNIHIVHYEDFILNEECKNRVSTIAGFNIKDYPINPEFAPYPKEKNIWWHHNYSKQNEIEYIKNNLSEYCHKGADNPNKEII